ncbi:SDR family NAD(P)-dependent oxidoreductase [Catenuloplanes atrovinosus]|uniref:NAD(P)-dependent dehydrogenase (Short-subunit alcohol dehydrogenase family) n=1 Tax=Catenuloplanes atrovinosus TaxID=137266 RepID=A0AAE3YYT0_9ACTN|nr:SDR family NAD(P)-dependent oxidoreductase [Catenuloplanes atrovinosus]MDR7281095.1 NAD(P)-dependent dehydrogenase (short-subunit alcohol dehydrogenase family) [Catenuloplanes atrovinosus]
MRTVFITGVSRGLGAALFEQVIAAGNRVVGIGRSFTGAQDDLALQEPARVALWGANLSDPSTLPSPEALRELFAPDGEVVLIHNAGTVTPIGPVGALPPDELAASITVNLTAPMLLTNAFLAAAAGRTARVLFISSGAAGRAIEHWSAYSAAKRGGEWFMEVLAAEAAHREPPLVVASVNPGVMDTGMQAALRAEDFPAKDRYVGLHERGELPDPASVAERIIREYLTSE